MGITVSGMGEATAAPDKVEIDFGVSVLAPTVAEAAEAAAQGAHSVVSALISSGVAQADLTTTEYSIQPEYDYSESKQRLVGYRVGNTVRATVREISRMGPIIDSVSGAGGDNTRINGLRFAIEDDTALEATAREIAWNDAQVKADQLARLSGQTLGEATSIIETVRPPIVPMPRMMAAEVGMERASTPIQPGTTTVTVNLDVEFGFRD